MARVPSRPIGYHRRAMVVAAAAATHRLMGAHGRLTRISRRVPTTVHVWSYPPAVVTLPGERWGVGEKAGREATSSTAPAAAEVSRGFCGQQRAAVKAAAAPGGGAAVCRRRCCH